MKFSVLFALLVTMGAVFVTGFEIEDIDKILNDGPLMRKHIDCVLDKGRCTKDGAEIKGNPSHNR